MNKEQILGLITRSLQNGTITKADLKPFTDEPVAPVVQQQAPTEVSAFEGKKTFSASNILYTIGGIILLIGIGTLLFRFWNDLSSMVRVVLTLGIALAAYVSGVLLRSNAQFTSIATVMQILGGVLAPIGFYVTLHELTTLTMGIGAMTCIAVILATLYIASLILFRSIIFTTFAIIFSTWSLYSIVAFVLSLSPIIVGDIYNYVTLAIGIGYLFLASYIRKTEHKVLGKHLDYFGSLGFFGALISLGGFSPNQNFIWELVGVLSLCGGLYLSSITHNRTLLKSTAFFIFVFIIKFTGEYFVDSFGWPIALIIGGIALIAVGFGLVRFNKRLQLP